MTRKIYHFCLSAFLYWLVAKYAGLVLVMPPEIVGVAVFLPPILGLMWGPYAAAGVYIGGILAVPEIGENLNAANYLHILAKEFWVFLAGWLPYILWNKIYVDAKDKTPSIRVHLLKKFLLIFFLTFVATSFFRALTVTETELEILTDWIFDERKATLPIFMLACFVNDFFVAIFLDLAWFFFLISRSYALYNSNESVETPPVDEQINVETKRARNIALGFYLLFPTGVFYLDKFQFYGMDLINVWLFFVTECLSMIDIYLVLMFYLMLRYRRSIMMEVVFLVSQTVFFSATVLGWGSSLAMGNMVTSHANDSLHAMSAICRERLTRTFFLVRQAVSAMKLQAVNSIESYERLAYDETYRATYLDNMKKDFNFTAVGIDGSISYYLRLIPEIEGTKGGFSMQREDARWEGALSPFIEREPIDLAPYDPDDSQKVGWFYIPMKSRSSTWIEPYVDVVTNFYVLSYVAPLFLEGKFIGVVGMDIDFNFIIQELRRMSIYDYGYVYLMDRNNTVLYHRYQKQGETFKPNPEFQEIEVYLTNGMWLGIATPLSEVHEERNRIMMHLVAAIIFVAMVISLISIALASRAIKPLAGMTEAAKRIASGDLNVKISYESGNELGILVRSIREMASKLEIYVYRDKLTGLRNAAAFISKAAELDAQKNIVSDQSYGVVIFDANFLKKVNDKYGHEAGNELLRHAANVIRKVFANSLVYRTGGDEFAAILEGPDYDIREDLLRLFDEKVAEEHFTIAGDTLTVSVARGLAIYERGMDFAAVSKKADVAMYNHKLAIKSKLGEEVR